MLPFPESARVRQYDGEFADGTAELTARDTGDRVNIGGIDRYVYWGEPLMFIKDNELTIIVPPADGGGYIKSNPSCAGGDYWWEDLSRTPEDHQVFELCGIWTGSMTNPERIEGRLSGSFGYYRNRTGPRSSTNLFCTAPDHHFTMVKH